MFIILKNDSKINILKVFIKNMSFPIPLKKTKADLVQFTNSETM